MNTKDKDGASDHAATISPLVPDTPRSFNAIRSQLGGWHVYSITVKAARLGDLMRSAPQAISAEDIQRGYDETHARRIAKFLITEKDWAMGPITCSISSDKIMFTPLTEDPSNRFGRVDFNDSPVDLMKILDGQHRRGGIAMILDGTRFDGVSKMALSNARKRLRKSEIEVRVMAIEEETDRRRVFSWMQRQRPLSVSERVMLDNSRSIDDAVQRIIGHPAHIRHQTITSLHHLVKPLAESGGKAVPNAEPWWLTAHQVRLMILNRAGRKNMSNQCNLIPVTEWIDRGRRLFDVELPALLPEWHELLTETDPETLALHRLGIKRTKKDTIVHHPTVIATASHMIHLANGRWELRELADLMQKQDYSTDAPLGVFLEAQGERKGIRRVGGSSRIAAQLLADHFDDESND